MSSLLWLVPVSPFVGFVVLAVLGSRFTRSAVAAIGVGSVGLATVVAILVGVDFVGASPPGNAYAQTLWTWIQVGNFAPQIGFSLDALSLVMILVVTVVSLLIHIYSIGYTREDEGYRRFFAYMNLFVGAMLTLVLADNLLLLYLGWEGVGLCSYLLIGFWYRDPANGRAARKAFIVTRIGDAALVIGIIFLFTNLGTLQIQPLMQQASQDLPVGSVAATAAAALLLAGALGKSAQLPLQTWLPDAMAGPTPVSALIHAATMVTAGVYLIARTHVLFALAPSVQSMVAIIGAATLLLAGCSALTQSDIKRVLAYSTISQIGYMFLALGVGAWSAAIFHLMTHAFFKALLCLAAGVVIVALHHEQNLARMGGLRRQLPLAFWTFLIGGASLSALPLVTAGFYSKELILWQTWSSPQGNLWLWAAGTLGALITALYTFRMVFLTFFGEPRQVVPPVIDLSLRAPLIVLAALSIVGGFVELPGPWGNLPIFTNFLSAVLPNPPDVRGGPGTELALQAVTAVISLGGIFLAYILYLHRPSLIVDLASTSAASLVRRLWTSGWGFDWLYERILVRPYVWFARADRADVVVEMYRGIAWLLVLAYGGLNRTQTSQVRSYAMGIGIGAALILVLTVFR
jgi:NADH-quinone oxidoreductase subunit L